MVIYSHICADSIYSASKINKSFVFELIARLSSLKQSILRGEDSHLPADWINLHATVLLNRLSFRRL